MPMHTAKRAKKNKAKLLGMFDHITDEISKSRKFWLRSYYLAGRRMSVTSNRTKRHPSAHLISKEVPSQHMMATLKMMLENQHRATLR